jgi:hypothetical protein
MSPDSSQSSRARTRYRLQSSVLWQHVSRNTTEIRSHQFKKRANQQAPKSRAVPRAVSETFCRAANEINKAQTHRQNPTPCGLCGFGFSCSNDERTNLLGLEITSDRSALVVIKLSAHDYLTSTTTNRTLKRHRLIQALWVVACLLDLPGRAQMPTAAQ